jgi:CHAD domain-containing protein
MQRQGNAMAYHLKRDDETVEAGIRRIAIDQIDSAIGEIDDESLGDHATVHQVRKRCKKLRGLIRLVRPSFGRYGRENKAFREAAAPLSGIRDAEAFIETYDALMDAYAGQVDRAAFGSIRRALTMRKKKLAADTDLGERLATFRTQMVAARDRAGAWRLDDDGYDAVRGGLKQTYRRARNAMDAAEARPTAGNLHEWRKRVKYHLYHARLLRDCWPEVVGAHAGAADVLSDHLGDHHNLAVFRQMLIEEPEGLGQANELNAFVGLMERRQALLEVEAFALGRRLLAEPPTALRRRWGVYWTAWAEAREPALDALAA